MKHPTHWMIPFSIVKMRLLTLVVDANDHCKLNENKKNMINALIVIHMWMIIHHGT